MIISSSLSIAAKSARAWFDLTQAEGVFVRHAQVLS
jgi:hypothetical protein